MTEFEILLLIALVLLLSAVAVCAVIALRAKENKEKHLQMRSMQRLENAFASLENITREYGERQDRLRDSIDLRIDALQASNEHRLEQIRLTVDEKLSENMARSFESVSKSLSGVDAGLGRIQSLMGEFTEMKKVLGGVKTRGIWGEIQLRALLNEMLAPGQFIENASIPAGSRNAVEFAVRTTAASDEALLPIDSKFPQEDYLRLVEANEAGDVKRIHACSTAFERALVEQARRISEKYIRPPQTCAFAVMFLPVESLYAEAVRLPGLMEKLQTQYHVLTAGPNTLAALLTSLRVNYTTAELQEKSAQILAALTKVRAEFDQYAIAANQVQKQLDRANEAMQALQKRSDVLKKALDGIEIPNEH